MHIVEVEHCREVRFGRTGKEVQTSVFCKNSVSLFNNSLNGSESKYIIEAFSVGSKALQVCNGVSLLCGIDIHKFYAGRGSIFNGED